jgi:hypothetical protein
MLRGLIDRMENGFIVTQNGVDVTVERIVELRATVGLLNAELRQLKTPTH